MAAQQPLALADFKPGQHVRYVPNHAHGDRNHPDCEDGVVTSVNDHYVFVRYGAMASSQATDPGDLVSL